MTQITWFTFWGVDRLTSLAETRAIRTCGLSSARAGRSAVLYLQWFFLIFKSQCFLKGLIIQASLHVRARCWPGTSCHSRWRCRRCRGLKWGCERIPDFVSMCVLPARLEFFWESAMQYFQLSCCMVTAAKQQSTENYHQLYCKPHISIRWTIVCFFYILRCYWYTNKLFHFWGAPIEKKKQPLWKFG